MNIGEAVRCRILELCKEHNITVNKLSTISGITQSTLNNIVSGKNNTTTVSTIKKIATVLESRFSISLIRICLQASNKK